jgi:uncharacterized protein (TIGR00299 family) protein
MSHHHHHDHDHDHDHHDDRVSLLPGDPEAHREPLPRGSGGGMVLFFDTPSGVAGDMTIAALVDLGVPFAVVEQAVAALGLDGYRLRLSRAQSGALGATHFSVEDTQAQPERRYRDIVALLEQSRLAEPVRKLAERIFARLASAEAEVHRVPPLDVGFHEVGAVDSIVDVVGTAACLEYLGARVTASPLPMGRGSVRTAHGVLPLPAPATVVCLKGVPTVPADLDAELVTPTGAAIVASVAESFERWPSLTPERIGIGAGTKVFAGRPNALRLVLGSSAVLAGTSELALLEANVDDMTGELAAHAIGALLALGALEAFATPVTMKKGRPGLVISALCRAELADTMGAALLRETTSLGVRRLAVTRVERPRRVVDVETRFGRIPVKVSEGPYGAPQVKPEFDACAAAAARAGVSVREVISEALLVYGRAAG